MDWTHVGQQLLAAVVFGAAGIVLYALAYKAISKVVTFSVEKEIAEDQNVALGILMGAMMLGLAIIVAAAIRG
jgi:uncharacterized membrane protein YjfL (UPF0719 family)